MVKLSTLTAIIYAIVKNVVIPARISVRKDDPLCSFSFLVSVIEIPSAPLTYVS